jgi:DNA-binding response OmpR family regulator
MDSPSILLVEDDPDLAQTYAAFLDDEYQVTTVHSGETAIDALDAAFGIVLLDRRLPVASGNEVLAAIENRNIECRVAMITSVAPDFDIINLGIDDYLVKPVTRAELRDTVSRLCTLDRYSEHKRKLTAKKLKRNLLEVEKSRPELHGNPEFVELTAEIAELEAEMESMADQLDVENIESRL